MKSAASALPIEPVPDAQDAAERPPAPVIPLPTKAAPTRALRRLQGLCALLVLPLVLVGTLILMGVPAHEPPSGPAVAVEVAPGPQPAALVSRLEEAGLTPVVSVSPRPAGDAVPSRTEIRFRESARNLAVTVRSLVGTGTLRPDELLKEGSDVLVIPGKDLY